MSDTPEKRPELPRARVAKNWKAYLIWLVPVANSVFWNAGGINVDVGLLGAVIRAQSFKTLMSGGVALLDDKVIQDNVKASLHHASATTFNQVQVVSSNGVVTLSGSVPDAATKAKAAQFASQVPQVRQVENNLQVRGP